MKQNNMSGTNFVIVIFIIVVICFSIVFLMMSSDLKINVKSNNNSQLWSVKFEEKANLKALNFDKISKNSQCGLAHVGYDVVWVDNTKLDKAGDKCIWPLRILNEGTFAAELRTITLTFPKEKGISCIKNGSQMTCENITYKLSKNIDGTDELSIYDIINANNYLDLYLIAINNGVDTNSKDKTFYQSGVSFTLVYQQK